MTEHRVEWQVRTMKAAGIEVPALPNPGRPSSWTPDDIATLLDMRADGATCEEIGRALGYKRERVAHMVAVVWDRGFAVPAVSLGRPRKRTPVALPR